MLYWHLFIAFAFIFLAHGEENFTTCLNCVSTQYMNSYQKYLDVLPSDSYMFPFEKSDCSNPKMVTCKECFGIKIDEELNGNKSVGFIYGCAERVMLRSIIRKNPVPLNEKLCKSRDTQHSYGHKATITTCRCNEASCNDPEKNFIDGDYPPKSLSQTLENSAPDQQGSVANPAVTPKPIRPTTLSPDDAIAYHNINSKAATHVLIDPLKIMFSILVSFFMFQLF